MGESLDDMEDGAGNAASQQADEPLQDTGSEDPEVRQRVHILWFVCVSM